MTFPTDPSFPTDIFGDEQPPIEEEPKKSVGDFTNGYICRVLDINITYTVL